MPEQEKFDDDWRYEVMSDEELMKHYAQLNEVGMKAKANAPTAPDQIMNSALSFGYEREKKRMDAEILKRPALSSRLDK